MGNSTTKPAQQTVASARVLMDAPRAPNPPTQQSDELPSPADLLNQPTLTLSKIFKTLDKIVDELNKRVTEGSVSIKDIRAFTDIVKAHATLRQTQLAEDEFAARGHGMSSDADIAILLIEAVKHGGPTAIDAMRSALESAPPTKLLPGSSMVEQSPVTKCDAADSNEGPY